jgi:hypothetical protein
MNYHMKVNRYKLTLMLHASKTKLMHICLVRVKCVEILLVMLLKNSFTRMIRGKNRLLPPQSKPSQINNTKRTSSNCKNSFHKKWKRLLSSLKKLNLYKMILQNLPPRYKILRVHRAMPNRNKFKTTSLAKKNWIHWSRWDWEIPYSVINNTWSLTSITPLLSWSNK